MSPQDQTLVQRWVKHQDASAFEALIKLYGTMVYSVSLRILKNPSDAEDIAQECFIKLSRSAGDIHSSLGGWLHRTATHTSINDLKKRMRRSERESAYEETKPAVEAAQWDDVKEYVDEAINELDEEVRSLVVGHFLEQKTYDALAKEHDMTVAQVRYRIDQGIEKVRATLKRRGVQVAGGVLATLLTAEGVSAAPATLLSGLGRMALAGTEVVGAGASIGLGAKVVAGLAACLVVAVGYVAFNSNGAPSAPASESLVEIPVSKDTADEVVIETIAVEGVIEPVDEMPMSLVTLRGKVSDEDGKPVRYATLGLKGIATRIRTDRNGQYRISEVEPGEYALSVQHHEYMNDTHSVELVDGQDNEFNIVMTQGSIVEGHVYLGKEPLEKAKVSVRQIESPYERNQVLTDQHGYYRMEHVGAYEGRLRVEAQFGELLRFYREDVTIEKNVRRTLDHRFENSGSRLVVTMDAGKDFNGKMGIDLRPPNKTLNIIAIEGDDLDSESAFVFDDLPEGEFRLTVFAEGVGWHYETLHIEPNQELNRHFSFLDGGEIVCTLEGVILPEKSIYTYLLEGVVDVPELETRDDYYQAYYYKLKASGILSDIEQGKLSTYRGLEPGNYTLIALSVNVNREEQSLTLAAPAKVFDIKVEDDKKVELTIEF